MSSAKHPEKKPSAVNRWKDAVSYDARAKARNWLRFLKRDTAIVTPDEIGILEKNGFAINYKGRMSGARSRVKAVGVQAVVQAIRMREDVHKVVSAVKNNDWTSVARSLQPLGLSVDYTHIDKNKKVIPNVL